MSRNDLDLAIDKLTGLREKAEGILGKEISGLPKNDGMALLEGWIESLPHPAWVFEQGDLEPLWYINRAYLQHWNIPDDFRPSFQTPLNLTRLMPNIPNDSWETFMAEDMEVIRIGKPKIYFNELPTSLLDPPGPDNPVKWVYVYKRPFVLNGRARVFGETQGYSSHAPGYDDGSLMER